MESKGSLKRFVAVMLGATFLAGCATFGAKPEEVVKARAQARWDALLKGDARAAYEFFSPGSKAVLDFQSYDASIRHGFWKSAMVESVACESQDKCEAQEQIEYEFQGRRAKTPLTETWIREGGNWWLVRK
jgi:hypothetical protein